MDKLQLFMHLYMYELEIWLNRHIDDVLKISFQSDEANPDRPLKEYLKRVIENECNCVSAFDNIEKLLVCINEQETLEFLVSKDIKEISIERVLLPEDITPSIKRLLQRKKNSIFTNPDLCLEINIDGETDYETVELKSTKTDAIPGSSVQQVSPDEWVIFVKHGSSEAQIAIGKYLHAVNSRLQFPDRSPRPQVSFSELQKWNKNCRFNYNNIVEYHSEGDDHLKYELLTDWQDVLAKRWADIVFEDNPKKHEPWFNNNLRKFILEFLEQYDEMSPLMQEKYKQFLKSVIT